ncbi:glycosyltransferase family 4 protein [Methylobacterium hispanicum]|uniref:glycosyltransferase family 4 protein n=1 Tax=Methylobacterium hispanicum TaxID=270350 RepID=UPI002F2BD8D1
MSSQAAEDAADLRVLVVDDRVPHPMLGAGSPRCRSIVEALSTAGAAVTFFPTLVANAPRTDLPFADGVLVHEGLVGENLIERLQACIAATRPDVLFVSRPHNMQTVRAALRPEDATSAPRIVYDAEAIFCQRKIRKAEFYPQVMNGLDPDTLLAEEIALTRAADLVLSVSESEADLFRHHGVEAAVLGHCLEPRRHVPSVEGRADFLFVGELADWTSPNTDSVLWFIDEVFPRVRAALPEARLHLAGHLASEAVRRRLCEVIESHGEVPDLRPLYDQARVFVAPTRFSAGVPYKVIEAAANGLPCVLTDLLLGQMGWKHEREALSASDADAFAQSCIRLYTDDPLWLTLRAAAVSDIERTCSEEVFKLAISDAFRKVRLPVCERGSGDRVDLRKEVGATERPVNFASRDSAQP